MDDFYTENLSQLSREGRLTSAPGAVTRIFLMVLILSTSRAPSKMGFLTYATARLM